MRSLRELIRDARNVQPGQVVACTRDELLHVLSCRQAINEAWTKLYVLARKTPDDEHVVRTREQLLEALDETYSQRVEEARIAEEQRLAAEQAEEARTQADEKLAAAAADDETTEATETAPSEI